MLPISFSITLAKILNSGMDTLLPPRSRFEKNVARGESDR
jgi:hypothetical protein